MFLSILIDGSGSCRWSSNSSEPLLFVKHDSNKLNILDAEKKALVLTDSVVTEKDGSHNLL